MRLLSMIPVAFATAFAAQKNGTSCHCTPSSFPAVFSSSFLQPDPPSLETEFTVNWNQHKWNTNVSHIASGFLYNSPANSKVRVDEAYARNIGTSLFDYKNVSKEGLVSNTLITYSPSLAAPPTVFEDYVNSDFPLFEADFLQNNTAVYTGIVDRTYNGHVASWSIMYQNQIPVTVYVSCCNVLLGYDYFSPVLRTRVVTEFFNVQPGPISSDVFKLPSH